MLNTVNFSMAIEWRKPRYKGNKRQRKKAAKLAFYYMLRREHKRTVKDARFYFNILVALKAGDLR